MKIAEQVAFVTGANRGLGQHIVQQLALAGVKKIYAAARDKNSLDHILAFAPDRIVPVELDVTSAEAITQAAVFAGDATLLINNAGVLEFGNSTHVSEAALTKCIAVNYFGYLNMARAFIPILGRSRAGGIVNILTLLALTNEPNFSAYCASKAASWSMTQSLRSDLAELRIKVVAVFPGGIDTDMLAGVHARKESPSEVAKNIVAGLIEGEMDIFPDSVSRHFRPF